MKSVKFIIAVAAVPVSFLFAAEMAVTFAGADAAGKTVRVRSAAGVVHSLAISDSAVFADQDGTPLANGLRSSKLTEGAPLLVSVERNDRGAVLHALRIRNPDAPAQQRSAPRNRLAATLEPKPSTGFIPLCDMTAEDRYKGEDGGLYGGGSNVPPPEFLEKAELAARRIRPLDKNGAPSDSGKIALVSISMSNATMEFSRFKQIADADRRKSPFVEIVDGAQGGQTMAAWSSPAAQPWNTLMQRLEAAQVSTAQVQVVWIKLANAKPSGELQEHGRKLYQDTQAVLQNARARFPNLQIAILDSRIYGGWAKTELNPEPYAYEGAFVVRWLIRDQMNGKPALAFDTPQKNGIAPLLLWGPYFWADGLQPRKTDGLIWKQSDVRDDDGTHPGPDGRQKAAELLLDYFTGNPLAKTWFAKP